LATPNYCGGGEWCFAQLDISLSKHEHSPHNQCIGTPKLAHKIAQFLSTWISIHLMFIERRGFNSSQPPLCTLKSSKKKEHVFVSNLGKALSNSFLLLVLLLLLILQ
jgi:hypothetical protein